MPEFFVQPIAFLPPLHLKPLVIFLFLYSMCVCVRACFLANYTYLNVRILLALQSVMFVKHFFPN